MDAIISLTVVLPLLPVTATNGILNRPRQYAASCPNPSRVFSTRIRGIPQLGRFGCKPMAYHAATAPFSFTSAIKSCPSNLSPTNAMNRSPRPTVRLSVLTPVKVSILTRPFTLHARAASRTRHHGYAGSPRHERPASYLTVTERELLTIYFLIRFMPLSCYYDHITFARTLDCAENRRRPIFLDMMVGRLRPPRFRR